MIIVISSPCFHHRCYVRSSAGYFQMKLIHELDTAKILIMWVCKIYMCVCVCVYVSVYVCMYVSIYIRMWVYVYVCLCIYTYMLTREYIMHTYVFIIVYTYACIYIYIYIYIYLWVCVYISISIYIYIYTRVFWFVGFYGISTVVCYLMPNTVYIYTGSLNKFPDFFRMGTLIDSTHMKL